MQKRDTILNLKLTAEEMRALNRAVSDEAMKTGKHGNRSEFVRLALRSKLAKYLKAA